MRYHPKLGTLGIVARMLATMPLGQELKSSPPPPLMRYAWPKPRSRERKHDPERIAAAEAKRARKAAKRRADSATGELSKV